MHYPSPRLNISPAEVEISPTESKGILIWTLYTMATHSHGALTVHTSEEVGGTLIGENGLVVMAGRKCVEWYPILHHMVSMCLMPFDSLRSGHYCEPSSPQQLPVTHGRVCQHTHAV